MNRRPAHRLAIRQCTLVYAALVLLTLVTWGVGRAGMAGLGLSLLLLGLALFKGFLVGDWFMGLRGLFGIWRWVVVFWLLIPGGLIGIAFVLSDRG